MCFVSRQIETVTFHLKMVTLQNGLLISFRKETHSGKIMEVVEDFVEKRYNNNNSKPWKSSRIFACEAKNLRTLLRFRIFKVFLHVSSFLFMFIHRSSVSSFFFISTIFIVLHFFKNIFLFFFIFHYSSFSFFHEFLIFFHFSFSFFLFFFFSFIHVFLFFSSFFFCFFSSVFFVLLFSPFCIVAFVHFFILFHFLFFFFFRWRHLEST